MSSFSVPLGLLLQVQVSFSHACCIFFSGGHRPGQSLEKQVARCCLPSCSFPLPSAQELGNIPSSLRQKYIPCCSSAVPQPEIFTHQTAKCGALYCPSTEQEDATVPCPSATAAGQPEGERPPPPSVLERLLGPW